MFTTFLNKNPNQIDTKTHIMKTHFLLETKIKLYSKNFTFTKEFSNKMVYMALLELFNNLHKSDNITIIPDIYPLVSIRLITHDNKKSKVRPIKYQLGLG